MSNGQEGLHLQLSSAKLARIQLGPRASGSLTLWVDEQAINAWRASNNSGVRGGRPRTYTDTAIECALVVKELMSNLVFRH